MGVVVIAGYKPKPGRDADLEELMKTHHSILKAENLVTERESIVARAKDGTIVEVFEWISPEAIQSAHKNKRVLEMWQEYETVCEYVPISTVPEARELFSGFAPLN